MVSKLGTKGTWLLAIPVAIVLIVVITNSNNKPDRSSKGSNTSGAVTDVSDDNSEETLRTVSSQYLALEKKSEAQEIELQKLRDQVTRENNTDNSSQQESQLKKMLSDEIDRVRNELHSLNNRVTQTTNERTDPSETNSFPSSTNDATSGYILNNNSNLEGLGWGDQNSTNNRNNNVQQSMSRIPGYASIVPLTHTVPETLNTKNVEPNITPRDAISEQPTASPRKTIPARSTLLGAKAMTALIGRVPVSGRLEDPYPVKLIVGHNNLAANGHAMYGLDGIIFDGVAKGDWSLGCVSVDIVGGTYIFDDGSIQHLTTNTGNSVDAATGSQSSSIGYISNPQGVPCIPGERITDAHKQAAFLALLEYGSGRFNARSQAETATIVSGSSGTSTSSVTGNAGDFELNAAVANSLDTVSQLYQERVQTTTDAVVAEAGMEVAIHITHDLFIDYQPNARRLQYVNSQNAVYQPTRLD